MLSLTTLNEAWPIHHFVELDSTNLEATRRAIREAPKACWIVADNQTAGRGRLGRQWQSSTENLLCTALLPLNEMNEEVPSIALTVGLSVFDVVAELTGDAQNVTLKWPNDVRLCGKKVSGVLLEVGKSGNGLNWIAIGVGLNLNVAPEIANYDTIAIRDITDCTYERENILRLLDKKLKDRLLQHVQKGRQSIIEDWQTKSGMLGTLVATQYRGEEIEGVCEGLDPFGNLLLRKDDVQLAITAGDVELVKRI